MGRELSIHARSYFAEWGRCNHFCKSIHRGIWVCSKGTVTATIQNIAFLNQLLAKLYGTRSALVNFGEHLLRPSALLALANFLSFLRVSATLLGLKICCQNSPNLIAHRINDPDTEQEIEKVSAEIERLIPSLKCIGVFDFFKPIEWIGSRSSREECLLLFCI